MNILKTGLIAAGVYVAYKYFVGSNMKIGTVVDISDHYNKPGYAHCPGGVVQPISIPCKPMFRNVNGQMVEVQKPGRFKRCPGGYNIPIDRSCLEF